jgi:hypothetical protein
LKIIFKLTLLGLVAGLGASVAVAAQSPTDASGVLAKAREALGGEKKLASIKTIVASGQTRQIRGENLIPIVFEINIELPSKYSRRDETPAVESGYSTTGFSGDDLIQLPQPTTPTMPAMPARPGGPPPPTPEQVAAQMAPQRTGTGRRANGHAASKPCHRFEAGLRAVDAGPARLLD